jgi:hypothetical protein
MAKRISLHEFQAGLARRLAEARDTRASALLAVQVGQRNWLIDLTEAGEILAVPPLATVPSPSRGSAAWPACAATCSAWSISPPSTATPRSPRWGTPACC